VGAAQGKYSIGAPSANAPHIRNTDDDEVFQVIVGRAVSGPAGALRIRALSRRPPASLADARGRNWCQDGHDLLAEPEMETETIRQYRRELAKLQRRLDALERTAEEYCGQEIATGTATAIEITKRQIAEVEATLERISGTNRA